MQYELSFGYQYVQFNQRVFHRVNRCIRPHRNFLRTGRIESATQAPAEYVFWFEATNLRDFVESFEWHHYHSAGTTSSGDRSGTIGEMSSVIVL
jgi:hypothetical protein